MILGLFIGTALAAPIQRVIPAERALGVHMTQQWVPRGSTVRAIEIDCGEGQQGVQVVSLDAWYRTKGVALANVGAQGCIDRDVLVEEGTIDGDPISEAELRTAFEQRFGAIDTAAIRTTPWGRIALPMMHEFSPEELAEEYGREGLNTEKQRERAIVAEGPRRDGAPIYAHFLGSDAPRSDRWGTLRTILQLLSLSDGWAKHCRKELPSTIAEANAETCLIQFGDVAWYNDTLPDPLGHREHYAGNCVDIRLFRNLPSRYEAWWNRPDDREGVRGGYSRALTQAFLEYAIESASPTEVHFNDPEVVNALPQVTAARGHDDHIHMCF